MDEILDQLEQRTEHSLVLTEKLFENYGMSDIQEFQKRLHERLKQKNFQLKELFSTKYQELLDCSELVNDIKVYTKKIVEISNVCEKSLNLLFNEENKQNLQTILNFNKDQESILRLKNQINKIFKRLTLGLQNGLSYIPNLIFEKLSILLKQMPNNSIIQIFVKEKKFILEQIKKSFINSLEDGSAILRVRKYFKNSSEINSFILSLDILFFFLKHDPENIVSRVLNFITQFFNYSPFEAVIVAQTLFTVCGNFKTSNLDIYFNLMHAPLEELLQLNSLEQFAEYCQQQEKNQFRYQNESSFILKNLHDLSQNFHQVLIQNIEKCLIKDEEFNQYQYINKISQLFQSLYQEQSVKSILTKEDTDQRLQKKWDQWLNQQISKIFLQVEVIPQNKNILKVENILQLKSQWDEKSLEVTKKIERIILQFESFPDIYDLEKFNQILNKHIKEIEQKIQEACKCFLEQRQDEQFDELLQQCACTSYYFGLVQQEFNKALNNSKSQSLQKQQIMIDDSIIRQNLQFIINEARINDNLTFRELIDILEKLIFNSYKLENEFISQQKSFTYSFIEISMNEYKEQENINFLDDFQSLSDADIIYYINIINLINPNILNTVYKSDYKTEQKSPKQLKRVTKQIKQSDQQNFVIFSQPLQTQTDKKFDIKSLDQSGLQAWTSKLQQQVPQTKMINQKQDQQQQNMFNIISSAKEKASNLTNLIYKQQQ